jgi:hypothetical protein
MAQHLTVIVPSFLQVEDKKLVPPETKLGQVVELVQAGERRVRVIGPQGRRAERVGSLVEDVLEFYQLSFYSCPTRLTMPNDQNTT